MPLCLLSLTDFLSFRLSSSFPIYCVLPLNRTKFSMWGLKFSSPLSPGCTSPLSQVELERTGRGKKAICVPVSKTWWSYRVSLLLELCVVVGLVLISGKQQKAKAFWAPSYADLWSNMWSPVHVLDGKEGHGEWRELVVIFIFFKFTFIVLWLTVT